MTVHLFRPHPARLSDWFAVAQDRSTWWALEFGLAGEIAPVESLSVGRLVGRLWPDASPGALYVASDFAVWTLLLRRYVTDPAFPPDAVEAWSARLVDAFVSGRADPDDAFARALANLRARWPAVCDASRVPAAAVELARFLDAVRLEAAWSAAPPHPDLATGVEARGRASALPLLLTCTPASLAPPLGVRETQATRALVRRASTIVAWSADLLLGDADGGAPIPNLVGWLANDLAFGWDEAVRAGVTRHDAEALAFVSAVEAGMDSADADLAWLARTVSDFVAGWGEWAEERAEPERLPWRPGPFVSAWTDARA